MSSRTPTSSGRTSPTGSSSIACPHALSCSPARPRRYGGRARVFRVQRSMGRPWGGHRPLRRGASARGGRPDRPVAAAPDRRSRSREPADRGRAGRDQPRGLARGRSDPLLPAGPLEPGGLLDRGERGRELGWRALLQVRLHDELCHRPRGGPPGRRAPPVGRQGARPPRLRSRRRFRRIGRDARRRDTSDPSRRPGTRDDQDARGVLRPHGRGGSGRDGDRRRRHRPGARSR